MLPEYTLCASAFQHFNVELSKTLYEKLGIQAEFIHERAENAGKMAEYREKFDVSCARAVANMSVLSEMCIPFVKVGGIFTAMKGPNEDISKGNNAIQILEEKLKISLNMIFREKDGK